MWRLRLAWFDLRYGTPTALARLYAALGAWRLVRVLIAFLWRSVFADPLRAIERKNNWRDNFTRHQLRPVLLLEDVLTRAVGPHTTMVLLADIVAASGARFIGSQVRHPAPGDWRRMSPDSRATFARALLNRFGNAETTLVEQSDTGVGFDVTFCHFVALCQAVGRPHLAPLFCRADSAYYDTPESNVHLTRNETLALGHNRCAFRLAFTPASETSSVPSAHAGDSQPGQTRANADPR